MQQLVHVQACMWCVFTADTSSPCGAGRFLAPGVYWTLVGGPPDMVGGAPGVVGGAPGMVGGAPGIVGGVHDMVGGTPGMVGGVLSMVGGVLGTVGEVRCGGDGTSHAADNCCGRGGITP